MSDALVRIVELIRDADTIAVLPHVYPDGDALGSALGLAIALHEVGKNVRIVSPSPVPSFFDFLPFAKEIENFEKVEAEAVSFDLAIAVDAADESRLGGCAQIMKRAKSSCGIDHHATNGGIGDVSWVEKSASATCVLIWKLCKALGVVLSTDIATCLYTGISTDTGHFSQRNTDSEAHLAASDCLRAGVDGAWLADHLHKLRSLAKTRLLSRALGSLEVFADGKVVAMKLSREDFLATGSSDIQTEGVVDFGIAVRGSLAAALCSERDGVVRVSMRSRPPVSVASVALALGGGGHPLAAGVTLDMKLGDAFQLVVDGLISEVNNEVNQNA